MKKIVPFKKDIVFDTNIAGINSISLEHNIVVQKERVIKGKFIVSGDYKMTDTSTNLDTFDYELPFNISVDKKYNIDDAVVDINDFYYEIVNSKILTVSIELVVDNILCVKEDAFMDEVKNENSSLDVRDSSASLEESKEDDSLSKAEEVSSLDVSKPASDLDISKGDNLKRADDFKEREEESSNFTKESSLVSKVDSTCENADIQRNVNVKSIFDNLDENESYTVYKVHIVTDNDTTESIMNDYGVTRESLEAYNNLSEIKTGDKIIVPANEN